jgi:hypothetical protein
MAEKAPQPNPLASNPLVTIDMRWTRAVKSLHIPASSIDVPSGRLEDAKTLTAVRGCRLSAISGSE